MHVLDSSALLAVIFAEPGAQTVEPLMAGAVISAVNLSEVGAKLVERGFTAFEMVEALRSFQMDTRAFDTEQALSAARLRMPTRSRGLSFGAAPAWPTRPASMPRP